MQVARLHVIVDVCPASVDPVELARLVVLGGAPLVQVRCKKVPDREAYEIAARIADLCRMHHVDCVINDRVDIAMAVGASGCHVGALDLAVPVVRRLMGDGAIVGGTARDAATARCVAWGGADYIGVGPIYATSSKPDLPDPLGLGALEKISTAVAVPLIAIAGVTVERVPGLIAAGAHGVAVISAIAQAADPRAMTSLFVAALKDAVGGR